MANDPRALAPVLHYAESLDVLLDQLWGIMLHAHPGAVLDAIDAIVLAHRCDHCDDAFDAVDSLRSQLAARPRAQQVSPRCEFGVALCLAHVTKELMDRHDRGAIIELLEPRNAAIVEAVRTRLDVFCELLAVTESSEPVELSN